MLNVAHPIFARRMCSNLGPSPHYENGFHFFHIIRCAIRRRVEGYGLAPYYHVQNFSTKVVQLKVCCILLNLIPLGFSLQKRSLIYVFMVAEPPASVA